jgi:hypothetical protein
MDIARLAGVTETECESLLAELDRNGVFSRTRQGVIYSRRMVRDAKVANKNQENGKKGGNPSLRKTTGKSHWDNPPDKGEDKAQKPEARNQKPDNITLASSSGSNVFARVDAALRKIEEVKLHPIAADPVIGHIVTLVEKGYDLDTHILPSIRRQLAKSNGKAIARWSYFVKGIVEDNTSSEASNATPPKDLELWTRRLKWARENRQWAYSWGPPPNFAACKAPKSLLLPGDGTGWGEWRAAE